jgi:hypothetical protein
MALTGPKPKPEDQRRNQNRPNIDWIQVVDVPYTGPVPELNGSPPAFTKRWWSIVSRMPHCILWDDADWLFAVETAQVHTAWVRSKFGASQAIELRQREKQLGLTWENRRDLRIKYIEAAAEEQTEAPVSLADRRKELQG